MTRRIRQLLATTAAASLTIFGLGSLGAQPASAIGLTRFGIFAFPDAHYFGSEPANG